MQLTDEQRQKVTEWISAGLPDDPPGLPGVQRITVIPGSRALPAPARFQQLAVIAKFACNVSQDLWRASNMSQRRTTVPPTRKHSPSSSSGRKGLIVREKTKKQSAKERTALDIARPLLS